MSEIRLICPGCGSDYALPVSAIPEAGREVECADCGRVWLARRGDAVQAAADHDDEIAPDDDAPPPQREAVMPSKRLAPDMLQFLKDEVEHERRLREAEGQTRYRPVSSEAYEADWPATTVTLPAAATTTTATGTRVIRHKPQPAAEPQPEAPARVRGDDAPTRPARVTRIIEPAPVPGSAPVPEPAVVPEPAAAPAPEAQRRSGYGAGIALMLAVAASVAVVYVAAPNLAPDSPLGETLMEWRGGLDRARLWLDGQAARLRG